MPFVRDPVPVLRDTQSRAYLERTLQQLDDWSTRIEGKVNELVRLRAISGLEVRYSWSEDTVIATPALTGEIKCDQVLPENATQYAISRTDSFGRLALTGIFELFETGFFEMNDITRDHFYEYTIDSAAIQRADDIVINVTNIASGVGAPPQAGDIVQAQWWPGVIEETAFGKPI